jgi:hypothetical protein
VIFLSLTQCLLQGACLSCLVARLNYTDKFRLAIWKEGLRSLSVELLVDKEFELQEAEEKDWI